MDGPIEYELDFIGWAERQAALLRALPPGTHGLDTIRLAEEVDDLGRAEIRAASSLLRQLLIHLIKLAAEPNSPARAHWIDEVFAFQADAQDAATGGIRQRLDLRVIWGKVRRNVLNSGEVPGVDTLDIPSECPFTLNELLSPSFDPQSAIKIVRAGRKQSRDQEKE